MCSVYLKNGPILASLSVYFRLIKAKMVCLGFQKRVCRHQGSRTHIPGHGTAYWRSEPNVIPLSYSGAPCESWGLPNYCLIAFIKSIVTTSTPELGAGQNVVWVIVGAPAVRALCTGPPPACCPPMQICKAGYRSRPAQTAAALATTTTTKADVASGRR